MPRYCKAYRLEDLRKYPKWSETAKATQKEMDDQDLVYIKEGYSVTSDCLDLDNADATLYSDITPEWEEFCKNELKFQVPDWEEESRRVREALAKEEANKKEA